MRVAILYVTVPATMMRSAWRGVARGAEPKRSRSPRGPPVCMSSMAQQAVPKSRYQVEFLRPQLRRSSTVVSRTPDFSMDMGLCLYLDPVGSTREGRGQRRRCADGGVAATQRVIVARFFALNGGGAFGDRLARAAGGVGDLPIVALLIAPALRDRATRRSLGTVGEATAEPHIC